MTHTTVHTRSRKVAIFGLALQFGSAVAVVTMAQLMRSVGLSALFWMLVCGIPIWVALLLVFRQRELAALEALDLEELRRERETKGGEALFGEQSGGIYGFQVAKARLDWMERFVVPTIGLFVSALLIASGVFIFRNTRALLARAADNPIPYSQHIDVGLIILSIITLLLFFCCRYALGLGRLKDARLLRAGGSYMFGCTLAALALVISFGIRLYQGVVEPEEYTALAILIMMVILGIETALNFVLDIYRPKTPGTESRSAFDSRLLGLVSEPTGITRSVAEAFNSQFGFQVSQTWFYQLLQRTVMPLVFSGALVVWALTCIVIVFPHEHAIVERFGRQLDPEHPLGPGIHFKAPAPFDIARKYPTGMIQQFSVGYKVGDQPIHPAKDPAMESRPEVEQWTDAKHAGRDHFNFVVVPTAGRSATSQPTSDATTRMVAQDDNEPARRVPVNLIRMEVFVQYRILADKLVEYTHQSNRPEDILRDLAWEEVTRVTASSSVDSLMGALRQDLGKSLREKLSRRVDELKLGIEVVEVGLLNVHPEKSVAISFRGVVTAQQERVAEIRKSRVEENKLLSQVAGNTTTALALSRAIEHIHGAEVRRARAEQTLGNASNVPAELMQKIKSLGAKFQARLDANWRLELALQGNQRLHEDYELGMGQPIALVREDDAKLEEIRTRQKSAFDELENELKPIREELGKYLPPDRVMDFVDAASADIAIDFWNGDLERSLVDLQGEAAVKLSEARSQRWALEMRAAAELVRVQNERFAYNANPAVYKARKYLQTLVDGMSRARKYFLAFDPGDRKIQVWIDAQEQARPDLANLPSKASE